MPTFDCYVATEAGHNPDGNEDACILDPRDGIFVIADGVGGRPGGARASSVATETFADFLRVTPAARRMEDATLRDAVHRADSAVRGVGDRNEALRGLASTLSAAVVGDEGAKVVHVGDSRVYRFHEGALEQLTRDHTVAAEMEREGARGTIGRRFQSMLSRAIGSGESVEADVSDVTLSNGDWLLLVTDGVTKALGTEELRVLMSETPRRDARTIGDRILRAAAGRDAGDNVTIAVVGVSP